MACHYHLFKWKNISIWLRLVCWFLQSTPGTTSTQDFGIATVQSLQWYKLTLPNNINSENMHESYRSENKRLDRSFNISHKMFGGVWTVKWPQWPNKSNTQNKVGGILKVCPLAAKPPNIKNLKQQVFELTTSFWLHRFSRLPKKKLKIFFYLCLHIGHGCFGPKFHISSIFRFVSIALGSGKIKIFQNFGFLWKWHTLMGKEW